MTSGTSPTPGSTSRGTATSTTSSGPPPRHAITISTVARSTSTSRRRGRREQHVGVDQRVGDLGRAGSRCPPIVGRELARRARACGSRRTTSVDAARRAASTPGRRPSRPRRSRARCAPSRSPRCSAATATAADGIDTGWRPMPRLGADPLARLDRVAEQPRQSCGAVSFSDRGLPRVAHLAEDLALADDHRVEAGRDREEVRDRGVVVVRVEVVGELVGIGARVARRGSRARRRPRGGSACSARRPRCGCTWRARTTSSRCSRAARSCSAFASCVLGHGHPLEQLDRHRAVVQTDDDQRHVLSNSFASSTRPARTRSRMPESKARCQSASSDWNAPSPAALPGPRRAARAGSRTRVRSPRSNRRRRYAASAGLRPPVPTATTRSAAPDHRHQRKGAVGRIVGAVDPDPAPPRRPRGRPR